MLCTLSKPCFNPVVNLINNSITDVSFNFEISGLGPYRKLLRSQVTHACTHTHTHMHTDTDTQSEFKKLGVRRPAHAS